MAKQKIIAQLKNDPLMPLRHTTEHILHRSMEILYPGLVRVMGPPIENGFYFDFDYAGKVSEDDFAKIEAQMQKIVDADLPIKMQKVSAAEAKKIFKDNPYKLEFIKEFEEADERISLSVTGKESDEFYDIDLCAGPHVKSTGKVKAFKLLSIAGAYWRGDESKKMLTRIYGTAFDSEKALEEYLELLEEAKERDHRKIGKQLDLYYYSNLVGPGLPLYTSKAGVIIEEIQNFMIEMQKKMGYGHVSTPHIAKEELYQTSGHLQWFKEGMYPPMEFEGEGKYYAKPMNCPFHIEIYKSQKRSYRELPIRYAEFGTVYRYEKSGEISGLMRTRGFTQDDAHIFCTEEQVVEEFIKVFDFTKKLLKGLGLSKYEHYLSIRGDEKDKYAGNEKQWDKATGFIREALKKAKLKYIEKPGEAAFYGPKLDIVFKDSLGRDVQISTVQVDFLLPERFNLTYIDKNNKEVQPYMIHRAPLGSRERILAILLEHYSGAFPVWLAPVQAVIIPITEKQEKYAKKVAKSFSEKNLRVEVDDRSETMQAKIRDAQLQKVPYMLIVGKREEEKKQVSVRLRNNKDLGAKKFDQVILKINEMRLTKSLQLW